MDILLNPATFDLKLLVQVVGVAMEAHSSFEDRTTANRVLTELKTNEAFCCQVPTLFENELPLHTQLYLLQALYDVITARWNVFDTGTKDALKEWVMGGVYFYSNKPKEDMDHTSTQVLLKLNLCLIAIVKKTWPQQWPNFISIIVEGATQSKQVCENCLRILTIMSEEVFDFGEDMISKYNADMKATFHKEVNQVISLCEWVIDNNDDPVVAVGAIRLLQQYLGWVSPEAVLENHKIIPNMVLKYLNNDTTRTDTLICVTKVFGMKNLKPSTSAELVDMFGYILDQISAFFPEVMDPPLKNVYAKLSYSEHNFIQRFSLFITKFMTKTNVTILEEKDPVHLQKALNYLVLITEVGKDNEMQLFKICLDFWHALSRDVARRHLEETSNNMNAMSVAKQIYGNSLNRVCALMIVNMAKPEEVLIEEDENGEIIRAAAANTDELVLYGMMRDTLVNLCELDPANTERLMLGILQSQVAGKFEWSCLNTLCWAIGSISGAMGEDDEKRFLVSVIKDLLYLCEQKTGKENKAVVASNIMYVVGQYPSFLRQHWRFLKTVVNKLFEFMHETHPGVQDMACETFIKIAKECKQKFVEPQVDQESEMRGDPFITSLFNSLGTTISDLKAHQIHTFFEAVGHMITAEPNDTQREVMLVNLMSIPNNRFQQIMNETQMDVNNLFREDYLKELQKIIRTNVYVCKAMGGLFSSQVMNINHSILMMYNAFTQRFQVMFGAGSSNPYGDPIYRLIQGVKKEYMKLVCEMVNSPDNIMILSSDYIPTTLEPILNDFRTSVPEARLSDVCHTVTTVIEKLKNQSSNEMVKFIMEALFIPAFDMIKGDIVSYPELRSNVFVLIKALSYYCFEGMFGDLIPDQYKAVWIQALLHGVQHTDRNISEISLQCLHQIIGNFVKVGSVIASPFFQGFHLQILNTLMVVLTDRLHKSGFKYQTVLLKDLFRVVKMDVVTVPIYNSSSPGATPGLDNATFLHNYMSDYLLNNFPHLNRTLVQSLVQSLFRCEELPKFRVLLRDFLITVKEFAAEDNTDLFTDTPASGSSNNSTTLVV